MGARLAKENSDKNDSANDYINICTTLLSELHAERQMHDLKRQGVLLGQIRTVINLFEVMKP